MTTIRTHSQRAHPVVRSDDSYLAEPMIEETPRHRAYPVRPRRPSSRPGLGLLVGLP